MGIFDFIEKKSYEIANKIGKGDSEDDIELYEYSVFMILSNTFTIGFGLLLSLIFGYFEYFIFSEISFIILRLVAGGSHCDSFKKCFFVSNTISLISCIIAMVSFSIPIFMIILAFSSCIITLPICPKPSVNSPSRGYAGDIKFRKKFAYRSLLLLILSIVFFYFNIYFITCSICSGILMVCFAVSDTGEKFIEKLSKIF